MVEELFKLLVLAIGGTVSVSLVILSFRILRASSDEYRRNQQRIGRVRNLLFGHVATRHAGVRDYRVRAGLSISKKDNCWEEQGALSEEAIDSVLYKQ